MRETDTCESALYPVFLDLASRRVVVVGAGEVAWRKVERLLGAGAQVLVVGMQGCKQMHGALESGVVSWHQRAYIPGDLDGACLCICATDDRETNRAVSKDAKALGIPVNVVDDPELCTATIPSVMRRGKLQIAISTSGASPALARKIRQDMEQRYDKYWERYLDVLAEARVLIKQRVPECASVRKPLFEALLDGRLEERIEQGENVDAEQAFAEYIAPIMEEERDL